jgi:serine/threonine protein kinase
MSGSIIKNRFILENELGRGGLGIVYKARDLRKSEAGDSNPYVAIKLFDEQITQDSDALLALQREVRSSLDIAHPNIASVYDFDRDGAQAFLVMELLEGESLDKFLRRGTGTGLGAAEAFRITGAICNAMSYAHERGIVHGDFKASSVFLTREGTVKVLDFGMSRAELPTIRDDLYAIARLAYELLTGRSAGQPQRPKELSRRQWEVLRSALDIRPEKRPDSAMQLLDGLVTQRRSPWVYFGVAAVAAAVIVGVYATMHFMTYRDRGFTTALASDNARQIESVLPSLRALPAERRATIFLDTSARAGLIQYFTDRVDDAVDPERGRYNYAQAETLIKDLWGLLPDSQAVKQLVDRVSERRSLALERKQLQANEQPDLQEFTADAQLEELVASLRIPKIKASSRRHRRLSADAQPYASTVAPSAQRTESAASTRSSTPASSEPTANSASASSNTRAANTSPTPNGPTAGGTTAGNASTANTAQAANNAPASKPAPTSTDTLAANGAPTGSNKSANSAPTAGNANAPTANAAQTANNATAGKPSPTSTDAVTANGAPTGSNAPAAKGAPTASNAATANAPQTANNATASKPSPTSADARTANGAPTGGNAPAAKGAPTAGNAETANAAQAANNATAGKPSPTNTDALAANGAPTGNAPANKSAPTNSDAPAAKGAPTAGNAATANAAQAANNATVGKPSPTSADALAAKGALASSNASTAKAASANAQAAAPARSPLPTAASTPAPSAAPAQVAALKQTLLTQARRNQVHEAEATLAVIKTMLPATDGFLVRQAPQAIGLAYLRLASRAAKEGRIEDAVSLAHSGTQADPSSPLLGLARDRYLRYTEISQQLQTDDHIFTHHLRYKIWRVSKLVPAEMPHVTKRWARDLALRIDATSDKNLAMRLTNLGRTIFPTDPSFRTAAVSQNVKP